MFAATFASILWSPNCSPDCAPFCLNPTSGCVETRAIILRCSLRQNDQFWTVLLLCLESLCYMQTVLAARDAVYGINNILEFTVVVPTENRVLKVFRFFFLLLPPWFSCNIPHWMNRNSAKTYSLHLCINPTGHSLRVERACARICAVLRVQCACARICAVRKEQKLISRTFCNKCQNYTPENKLFIQDNCEFLVFYAE